MDEHTKLVIACREVLSEGTGPFDSRGRCEYCGCRSNQKHPPLCAWQRFLDVVREARTMEETAALSKDRGRGEFTESAWGHTSRCPLKRLIKDAEAVKDDG